MESQLASSAGEIARRTQENEQLQSQQQQTQTTRELAVAEAARVLRPGGRFAVSDVIADEQMDDATRADMAAWTGCIAGALTRREFERALGEAGFAEIEIR